MNISSVLGLVTNALHINVAAGVVAPATSTKETLRGFFDQLLLAAEPLIEGATQALPGGGLLAELEHIAIASFAQGVQTNTTTPATTVTVSASAAAGEVKP